MRKLKLRVLCLDPKWWKWNFNKAVFFPNHVLPGGNAINRQLEARLLCPVSAQLPAPLFFWHKALSQWKKETEGKG